MQGRTIDRAKYAALVLLIGLLPGTASAMTIGDLVAGVSTTRLQGHVSALEGQRFTPAEKLAASSYVSGQLTSFGYTPSTDASGNVIATLTGTTTPSQTFIVGAHFDSVFGTPGADDNATGVAGMLELAQLFSTRQFESTIQFVAFADEELGLAA